MRRRVRQYAKIFVRFGPLAGLYYWMMTDSQKLLAEYAASGSEAAFRDLLTRYLNLVYSTAVRLVDGDTYLAQAIAMTTLQKATIAATLAIVAGGGIHQAYQASQ